MRAYEFKGEPGMRPPHPGSVLRLDVLPALGVTVAGVAKELGISRQLLHGILAERSPVSAAVAVRLGKWCGNGPRFWAAMQQDYDVWIASAQLKRVMKAIPTRRAA